MSLMNWAGSVSALTVGMGVEAVEVVTGRSPEISPRVLRRLLLSLEDSFEDGRALRVFGDTHEQRVDTLRRLMRGADQSDFNDLVLAIQEAFARNAAEEAERRARGGRRHGNRDDRRARDERRASRRERVRPR